MSKIKALVLISKGLQLGAERDHKLSRIWGMTKAKRGLVEGGRLTVFLERHGEVGGQTAFSSRLCGLICLPLWSS